MMYRVDDYIRFDTPEQWEQIVKKLKRDGQLMWTEEFDEDYSSYVVLHEIDSEWSCHNSYFRSNGYTDISEAFWEDLQQEELCKNPPLEVGDVFEVEVRTYTGTHHRVLEVISESVVIMTHLEAGNATSVFDKDSIKSSINSGALIITKYTPAKDKEYSVKWYNRYGYTWEELR